MAKNYGAWSLDNSIEFYKDHRSATEELYESEKVFLPVILKRVSSVLDVGCAAGGFSKIMKEIQPNIDYTGIDVAPRMIEAARTLYQELSLRWQTGTISIIQIIPLNWFIAPAF